MSYVEIAVLGILSLLGTKHIFDGLRKKKVGQPLTLTALDHFQAFCEKAGTPYSVDKDVNGHTHGKIVTRHGALFIGFCENGDVGANIWVSDKPAAPGKPNAKEMLKLLHETFVVGSDTTFDGEKLTITADQDNALFTFKCATPERIYLEFGWKDPFSFFHHMFKNQGIKVLPVGNKLITKDATFTFEENKLVSVKAGGSEPSPDEPLTPAQPPQADDFTLFGDLIRRSVGFKNGKFSLGHNSESKKYVITEYYGRQVEFDFRGEGNTLSDIKHVPHEAKPSDYETFMEIVGRPSDREYRVKKDSGTIEIYLNSQNDKLVFTFGGPNQTLSQIGYKLNVPPVAPASHRDRLRGS